MRKGLVLSGELWKEAVRARAVSKGEMARMRVCVHYGGGSRESRGKENARKLKEAPACAGTGRGGVCLKIQQKTKQNKFRRPRSVKTQCSTACGWTGDKTPVSKYAQRKKCARVWVQDWGGPRIKDLNSPSAQTGIRTAIKTAAGATLERRVYRIVSCRKCGSQSPEGSWPQVMVVISLFCVERLFLILVYWLSPLSASQTTFLGNNSGPNMLNSEGTSIQSSHLTDEETESQSKLQGFLETGEGLKVKLHYLFSTPPTPYLFSGTLSPPRCPLARYPQAFPITPTESLRPLPSTLTLTLCH